MEVARAYLRENVAYTLGDRDLAGLKKFYQVAADLGVVPAAGKVRFHDPDGGR